MKTNDAMNEIQVLVTRVNEQKTTLVRQGKIAVEARLGIRIETKTRIIASVTEVEVETVASARRKSKLTQGDMP